MAAITSAAAQDFVMSRVDRVKLGDETIPEQRSYPVAVAIIRRPASAAALKNNRGKLQPATLALQEDVPDEAWVSDSASDQLAVTAQPTFTAGHKGATGLKNVAAVQTTTVTRIGHTGILPGEFKDPHGLAGDADGNVYVADTGNSRIQKLSHAGEPLMQIGHLGSANGELKNPFGIVVERDGSILVADTGNHRIERFSATGEFLETWGSQGSNPGQFLYPQGITVDNGGNIYVADFANHRIQKFTKHGKLIATWGQLGSLPGQFNYPSSLAIDGKNRLWVTDLLNHRLQAFTLGGQLIGKFGSYSENYDTYTSSSDEMNHPRGVAVASNGDLWIAHPGMHCVDRLRPAPTAVASAQHGHNGAGD
jgi:sugar lactone lactonase YvrE